MKYLKRYSPWFQRAKQLPRRRKNKREFCHSWSSSEWNILKRNPLECIFNLLLLYRCFRVILLKNLNVKMNFYRHSRIEISSVKSKKFDFNLTRRFKKIGTCTSYCIYKLIFLVITFPYKCPYLSKRIYNIIPT